MVTILYVYRASSFKGKEDPTEEGNEELKTKMQEEKKDVNKVDFFMFPYHLPLQVNEIIEMYMFIGIQGWFRMSIFFAFILKLV